MKSINGRRIGVVVILLLVGLGLLIHIHKSTEKLDIIASMKFNVLQSLVHIIAIVSILKVFCDCYYSVWQCC